MSVEICVNCRRPSYVPGDALVANLALLLERQDELIGYAIYEAERACFHYFSDVRMRKPCATAALLNKSFEAAEAAMATFSDLFNAYHPAEGVPYDVERIMRLAVPMRHEYVALPAVAGEVGRSCLNDDEKKA